jgi:hypothetical protein
MWNEKKRDVVATRGEVRGDKRRKDEERVGKVSKLAES